MPKRKISSGPTQPQQGCSDGAKMLIEQMKANPDEFRGYSGKFTTWLDTAQDVVRSGVVRGMSKRDAAAIVAAAEEHLYEVWLAADVLTKMMAPKQDLNDAYGKVISGTLTGAVLNTALTDPRALYAQQVDDRETLTYKAKDRYNLK